MFASCGVDSVHYCLIPRNDTDGESIAYSVYIIVDPTWEEHGVELVAPGLKEFLNIVYQTKNTTIFDYSTFSDSKNFYGCIKEINEDIANDEQYAASVHAALEALNDAFDFELIENVFDYIHSIRSNTANHCEYTLPVPEEFD